MPRRSRSRSKDHDFIVKIRTYNGGSTPSAWTSTQHRFTDRESIQDSVNSSWRTNEVTHTKIEWTPLAIGDSQAYSKSTNKKYDQRQNWYASEGDFPLPGIQTNPGFVSRGVVSIAPSFQHDVQILNFIAELRDLKRTLQFVPSLISRLKSIKREGGALKKTLKSLAEGDLTYSFGVAPLLSDLAKLGSVYQSYLDKMDWLNKNAGKPQRGRYREKVSVPEAAGYTQRVSHQRHYRRKAFDVTWNLTLYYTYTLSGFPKLPSVKSFARFMGVRWDPEALWNAVPYSFVLDWVLKVGDWLSQFDDSKAGITVNITDAAASYQFKCECEAWQTGEGTTQYSVPGHGAWGSYSYKSYRRWQPTIDLTRVPLTSTLRPDELSVREQRLAGSLIISKLT